MTARETISIGWKRGKGRRGGVTENRRPKRKQEGSRRNSMFLPGERVGLDWIGILNYFYGIE